MSKKVLLIEDDTELVLVYKMAFVAEEITVSAAVSGMIGWEVAKRDQPAVVIFDVITEDDSAAETITRFKTDPETKNLPLIVFANFRKKSIQRKFWSLGVDELWHSCDFSPAELALRLRDYLENLEHRSLTR